MGESVYQSKAVRLTAWSVWIALAIVCNLITLLETTERSVFPNYRAAVKNWIAVEPLYNLGGSGFVYAPQAAMVFVPWGILPKPFGEIVWAWTNLGILAAGVYRFTRLLSTDDRWFLVNSLVSVAMAAGCARNGQATLIITGLMILGAADAGEKRWWRATILLAIALAFKPVAFVLILLVAAIYPQMLWRLFIGTAVVALAPYLTHPSHYVTEQFVAFYQNSRVAFGDGETGYWAHLFGMLKVAGLDLPSAIQQAGRVIFAVGTLAVCWLAVKRLPANRGTYYLFAFSNCYLMLFNSRTEGSTYAMLGPVYGLLLAEAWFQGPRTSTTVGFVLAIVATVFNFDIARILTPPPREIWLAPFVCVVVTIYLLFRLSLDLRNHPIARQTT